MQSARFDHLIVAATDADAGAAWLEATWGITFGPGGQHPLMGTRNRLGALAGGGFLEVISIDPSLPPPGRPRWMGLDDPQIQAEIALRPRLVAWAAHAPDLEAALQAEPLLGQAEAGRRGDLSWTIAVRGDGLPPRGGVWPVLLHWPGGAPPVERMQPLPWSLLQLVAADPEPAGALAGLERVQASGLVALQAADRRGLRAVLAGPGNRLAVLD